MVKSQKKKTRWLARFPNPPRGSGRAGPQARGYEVIAMLFVMHSDGEVLSTLDMLANTRSPRGAGGDVRKARKSMPGALAVASMFVAAGPIAVGLRAPAGPARAAEAKGGSIPHSIDTSGLPLWTLLHLETSASVPLILDRGLRPDGTCRVYQGKHMRVG